MYGLFTPYVFSWLKATRERLLKWASNAIDVDERTPVTEDCYYSAGIVDVFSSVDQAYRYLEQLNLNTMFVNTQFAEVACDVIKRYVELEVRHRVRWLVGCTHAHHAHARTLSLTHSSLRSRIFLRT